MSLSISKTEDGSVRFNYSGGEGFCLVNLSNVEVSESSMSLGQLSSVPVIVISYMGGSKTVVFNDLININGEAKPLNIIDTINLLADKVFNLGGGDGTGSQTTNSVLNNSTEPLFEDELNTLYPDAKTRFLVFAPNIGSGMIYLKLIIEEEVMWDSWPASRALVIN